MGDTCYKIEGTTVTTATQKFRQMGTQIRERRLSNYILNEFNEITF